jgi:2-keto-4-pentenoate hydratase/2-oxohepta-3-ene-1,7-dioic acid hydratase in catechol pathway
LDYVAAYTCGNDISSRKLQRDPAFAGKVPQWGFSKGFDTFAPIGPCLINPTVVGDVKKLLLKTVVNGEVRQKELVDDLLFDCAYLISYLSSGTTLRRGSVIMTGTPGGIYFSHSIHSICPLLESGLTIIGVGAGMNPPQYLVPGTSMEVIIENIGTLKNGVEFA